MTQNSQTWHLQILLDTYTYSRGVFVPAKTLKVRKIHSYNDLRKLIKPHLKIFVHHLLSSVELAYRKSGTSTVLALYMKPLLSLACVILDQENLRNFTRNCIEILFVRIEIESLFVRIHFLFIHCTRLFICLYERFIHMRIRGGASRVG